MADGDDFQLLVSDLAQILKSETAGGVAEIDIEALSRRLRAYSSVAAHWQRYAHIDTTKPYTRNGVSRFGGAADLLVLVWPPGQGSAVHDHAGAHCLMKVLQGTLTETLYEPPAGDQAGQSPAATRVSTLSANEVGYITDSVGIHKITNEGSEVAVSLHLYTPPWASQFGCNVYDTTGKRHVPVSGLYSENGVVLQI